MRNGNCGKMAWKRWVKCRMRKFAYVGDRLSIINSCKWACYTVVVRTNLIKFENVFCD